jgi:AraC family cel operon transcriptional repressor
MEPKLLTADRFVDPTCGCSYRYVHSDTEYFRPHYHDYYEIFVLLDGAATHVVNGMEIPLERASVVFIRPSDTHDYLCRDGKPFSMVNFTFTRETADALLDFLGEGFHAELLLGAPLPPTTRLSESDLKWFHSHMAAIRAIDPEDSRARKTAIRIFLFRLITKCFSDFDDGGDSDMPTWLSDLCEQMQKNGNFTGGAARMFALTDRSREHVARTLKKHTGLTVSEFINDLRLRFIANTLLNSNHSITDIIYESGFNNVSWASEQFRQKYGVSMRDFRRGAKK